MYDTGKQQFNAKQSIYQLLYKDHSVWMISICDVVFGFIYNYLTFSTFPILW